VAPTRNPRRKHVCSARRLVVKVGTNVLAAPGQSLNTRRIGSIARQIGALVNDGRQVALVSSGAIGCGMVELGMAERPSALPMLQAAASVGQGKLVAHYERNFRRCGLHAAQVLLTQDDVDSRKRYLNARDTLHALFRLPCVPVINENDAISTEEIKLGDNDRLAAMVIDLIRADLLILLSCVSGLYAERPTDESPGRALDVVEHIGSEVEALVYDETSPNGLGGMRSKVDAARMATSAGAAAIIADGRVPDVITRIMDGEPLGTLFLPSTGRLSSYKRWLRFNRRPRGRVQVDRGARKALVEGGKSLLPSGITGLQGDFQRGDGVSIEGPDGEEIARGLAEYSRDEIGKIMGRQTREIEGILGYKYSDEVVHRDNLALTQ